MNKNFKYNYIIIGSTGYYEIGYRDVMELENVRYFSSHKQGITSKFALLLLKLTFSKKVNSYIKEPFARFTFKRIYSFHFSNQKPLCFLIFGHNQFLYNSSYMNYISIKYPNAKKVLYIQDLISRTPDLAIDKAKQDFDIIYSYDQGDCSKYNLEFWSTPYSNFKIDNNQFPYCDVFYCGDAKMRYKTIIEVYNKCRAKGLICLFFIVSAPLEGRIQGEGLIYDQRISYIDNLKYVTHAKCILEVMQVNADGYTPRLWESIIYDKHLLTDNMALKSSVYYCSECMHDLSKGLDTIDTWINQSSYHDKYLKNSLSPINLLKDIDSKL